MALFQQGMNQQTPAVLNTLTSLRKADGTGKPTGTRRRRKRKTAKATSKRKTRKRKTTKAPKKGSAAMKRKMAKLRARRKK